MNILIISRAYPPVIGGIEKHNYEIFKGLARVSNVKLLANTQGKKMLPIFIFYVLIKSLFILRKYDIILLGDGLLAIVGYFFKLLSHKPIVCNVYGLDLTYQNFLYQKLWINIFIKKMDTLIAVGNETIHQGVMRGIPRSKFVFVPSGVSIKKSLPQYSTQDLEKLIGREIRGGVLLTLGRLVKRKGVAWFIEAVVRNLNDDVVYIIAGDGKEHQNISVTVANNELQNRVFCLGAVSEKAKEILFCTADIFVQPNIKVKGDMEGFGLVVLEAASYGLVVVASRLEGLKDAIHDGKNGILMKERDAKKYKQEIEYLLMNDEDRRKFGMQARKYVAKHFSWENSARKYMNIFEGLISNSS